VTFARGVAKGIKLLEDIVERLVSLSHPILLLLTKLLELIDLRAQLVAQQRDPCDDLAHGLGNLLVMGFGLGAAHVHSPLAPRPGTGLLGGLRASNH
jgi:hypothetical protein